LRGDRTDTWSYKETCWPKDFLPQDIPKARVMTFGYDVDTAKVIDTASNATLRNHGAALIYDLAMDRSDEKAERRPLIFVAHSLGGLVVEQVS
jgi:hypothetical protein